MAARPRITARQYEDFQPSSSVLQEKDCETLTVDLIGFSKEQIKVQMNDRSRTVMISGERPMGNNKWRRFRKDLQVPINCNTTEIQAKFENAILKITMPLKTEAPKSVENPSTILPKLAPLPPLIQPPPPAQHTQKPIMDPKLPTAKLVSEPKLPKPAPVAPPPPTHVPNQPRPIPQPPPSPPPAIQKPDFGPKPTSTPQPRISEKLNPISAPYHPLSPKHTTDSKDTLTEKPTQGQELGIKPKYDHDHDDHKLGSSKVTKKNIDLKTSKPEDGAPKIAGDGMHMRGKSENEEKLSNKIKEETEESKHASGSASMDWDESKPLIINMVAAVLVIIALFVHIKYIIKFPTW